MDVVSEGASDRSVEGQEAYWQLVDGTKIGDEDYILNYDKLRTRNFSPWESLCQTNFILLKLPV